MRPILQNQPQIESVSWYLLEALKRLVSAIQAGWNAQHTGDGGHTDITATSATMTGRLTTGRLNLVTVTLEEVATTSLNNLTAPNLANAGCLRIIPETNPMLITGIDSTGFIDHDMLLVINADYTLDPADIQFVPESASSTAENRFADTVASPGGGGANFVLNGARAVWLVRDIEANDSSSPTPPSARWRIVSQ